MTTRFMRTSMPGLWGSQRFMNNEVGYTKRKLGRLTVKGKTSVAMSTLVVVLPAAAYAPAYAQAASDAPAKTAASSLVTVDSVAAAAAWAKADTGRMMPGYHDLSAYDRPGYCLAAMRGKEELTWRRGEADTLPKRTVDDTLPIVVREIGRACLARMTPQTVPRAELYNLMRLALSVGDTAFARQTVAYELSITKTNAKDRGYVLVDAISAAGKARPMQVPFMESLLPRFATLGKEAIEPTLMGYVGVYGAAHDRFDTTVMLRNTAVREALLQQLTPEERQNENFQLGGAFIDSLEIVWYQHVPNLSSTVNRLTNQWVALRGEETANHPLIKLMIAMRTTEGTIPGQPAYNFNIFKRYPADAPFPFAPGKVTVVLPLRMIGNGRLDEALGRMRRMYERYHTRGLEVMLVGRTRGYVWGSPPLAAEQEADLFGWYYREHLKLPFTVVVEETSFSKRPDGRKFAEQSPSSFGAAYSPLQIRGYIVGRDGIMKTINYGFHNESELEAYILRELAVPATAAAGAKADAK